MMVFGQSHYIKTERIYAFLLAEILNFQGSTHLFGVGSFSKLVFPSRWGFYRGNYICQVRSRYRGGCAERRLPAAAPVKLGIGKVRGVEVLRSRGDFER